MGNKWTFTPVTSDIIIEEEEPPDQDDDESTLTVTLLDVKNFSLSCLYSKIVGLGNNLQLIVCNTFNSESINKTMKLDDNMKQEVLNEWLIKTLSFTSNDPEGEIKVSLFHCPRIDEQPEFSNRSKPTLVASITIPVTLHELKCKKHIDRWIDVEGFESVQAQVLVSLDYFYHPSRIFRVGQKINDKYEVESNLGTGQFVVRKACNKHTMKDYAVKYIHKQVNGQDIPRSVIDREIDLLQSLYHPNIVEFIESIEDSETVYIVMELIKGSDLYEITETLGSVRPGVTGAMLGQLVSAVFYLHSNGIAHHDIKPENIVVDYFSYCVKLADFGSAKKVKEISGSCGTIPYMAPEVLQTLKGTRTPVELSMDIWSIGVVAYVLLSGRHPFEQQSLKKSCNNNIINRIISGKYDFPKSTWKKIPKHCKDFIKKCLVVDPKKRATISDLAKHPWIVASAVECAANSFTLEEYERMECARTSSSGRSRSVGSMRSLFELFGSNAANNNLCRS